MSVARVVAAEKRVQEAQEKQEAAYLARNPEAAKIAGAAVSDALDELTIARHADEFGPGCDCGVCP